MFSSAGLDKHSRPHRIFGKATIGGERLPIFEEEWKQLLRDWSKIEWYPDYILDNICQSVKIMAESADNDAGKKLIRIDISSDTVCPWCCVGKKNLDKAIATAKNQFDFEIKWHPFFLNPSAPKEGVNKKEYYLKKFGSRAESMEAHMREVFRGIGLEYSMSGLTGNTVDSHRLIYYAGTQGLEKQHKLVEELFTGYFTRGRYIGDREFLGEAAAKAGVDGAAEFLDNPNNGLQEVNEELEQYSSNISGVPHFVINGKHRLSGGQPPEVFLRAFEVIASGK